MGEVLARLAGINLSSPDSWFFVPGTGDGLPRSAERVPGRPASAPPRPCPALRPHRAVPPHRSRSRATGKETQTLLLLSLDHEKSLKGREGKRAARRGRHRRFPRVAPGLQVQIPDCTGTCAYSIRPSTLDISLKLSLHPACGLHYTSVCFMEGLEKVGQPVEP
ncbi:lactosylceramide 1,3-N-acetyl-beta-D-glucosaminyltransferase isoform X3 [Panthera pardus]|uniref:Lactosylceramide 1,3-N-acetyl-beta-D-glucosaminyltransferase isoform X3 n=1 Tax=Panthera pardus TaxID=9691 RepID=A0A9W2VLT4_PANPR|nr:lactosylceramide 1,3-N-acetyl-beta-D-glucosaminyltransferase isoform X3 [Panthera pardus]